MASARVKSMLYEKNAPFTPEQLETMSDREGWAWIYKNFPPATRKPKKPKLPEVCFTGFNDAERAVIESKAAEKFNVVRSVTVNLAALVLGPFPGPSKIERARDQGTPILGVDAYNHFFSTGELKVEES